MQSYEYGRPSLFEKFLGDKEPPKIGGREWTETLEDFVLKQVEEKVIFHCEIIVQQSPLYSFFQPRNQFPSRKSVGMQIEHLPLDAFFRSYT